MGYDWPHLTHDNHSVLVNVYDDWNLVVDDEHINGDDSQTEHEEDESDEADNSGELDDITDENGSYTVGHTTLTFIIDQQGNKRLVYVGANWDVHHLLEDLHALIEPINE
jgi:cytochrome oxidase Cu insertion factor (SCO1/SenC/PrrC family)